MHNGVHRVTCIGDTSKLARLDSDYLLDIDKYVFYIVGLGYIDDFKDLR